MANLLYVFGAILGFFGMVCLAIFLYNFLDECGEFVNAVKALLFWLIFWSLGLFFGSTNNQVIAEFLVCYGLVTTIAGAAMIVCFLIYIFEEYEWQLRLKALLAWLGLWGLAYLFVYFVYWI